MRHTWRWFGKSDVVALEEIEQAGAKGIVTTLHHVPNGGVWTIDEIKKRQEEISMRSDGGSTSLQWEVVESLPVSEEIKKQDANWRQHLENFKLSLRNLADCGLQVVCYNFMPILDWTRTDLAYRLQNGATCMRFDFVDFAVFDIFILKRMGAEHSFEGAVVENARIRFSKMNDAQQKTLSQNIVAGLPGANQNLTMEDIKALLEIYRNIDETVLRKNLQDFLEEVIPIAEEVGVRLCCHPDDPPFALLGLPRIMSNEQDYSEMLAAVESPSNGMILCSGSLGAHVSNDLPGMMSRLGHRVHFLHLRNVVVEENKTPGSFYESEHLNGNTDMVALIGAILEEETRRKNDGRADWEIPMRPDHGQDILDDLKRGAQPGYPAIGRLKGLAELRGVEHALSKAQSPL